jgi:hypothetical protein
MLAPAVHGIIFFFNIIYVFVLKYYLSSLGGKNNFHFFMGFKYLHPISTQHNFGYNFFFLNKKVKNSKLLQYDFLKEVHQTK